MKITSVVDQALEALLTQKKNLCINAIKFRTTETALAVAFYARKRKSPELAHVEVSRVRGQVFLSDRSNPSKLFVEFSPESFRDDTPAVNGTVEVSSNQVLRIDGKMKLKGADLVAFRQILDSNIVSAVEIHKFDQEAFEAIFPDYTKLFSLHNKNGFLLLL